MLFALLWINHHPRDSRGDYLPHPAMSDQQISESLKAYRHRWSISQFQLASRLGISVRTLENWEQGKAKPQGYARISLEKFLKGEGEIK